MLAHHSGTVNQVQFSPSGSHLFSASDDGTLTATKSGSWLTENAWMKPHSGKAVTQIAIHPSGKLALTLGRDSTLRTWNLLKGRQCFTTNLKSLTSKGDTIEQIHWSPSGNMFSLIAIDKVLLLNINARITDEITNISRTISMVWLDDSNILLGLMNGNMTFYNLDRKEVG